MVFHIGSDHRGYDLKEKLKGYLKDSGYEVVDDGPMALDPNDDYPKYASVVATQVSADTYGQTKGILICGSGAGVCVVANKFPGIRAGLISVPDQAYAAKEDDDINILCLASEFTDLQTAKMIIASWIQTPFSNEEKDKRRLREIAEIESSQKQG